MLPFITVNINNKALKALVDTGCQQSVIQSSACSQLGCQLQGPNRVVEMLNGESTRCCGEAVVSISVNGVQMQARCLVAPRLVCDAKVIIEMDLISRLGGVFVSSDKSVSFGESRCAAGVVQEPRRVELHDTDFAAIFDGSKWTVEWKWERGEPNLTNMCHEYTVPADCREEFDNEVNMWIQDG